MTRPYFLLLTFVFCAGCAGTQSELAFMPRRAAEIVPPVTLPNCYSQHDRKLAESLARSLQEQEANEPELLGRQGSIADKPSAAPSAFPASDSRGSKTAGSDP
jgi:hypothetical protein